MSAGKFTTVEVAAGPIGRMTYGGVQWDIMDGTTHSSGKFTLSKSARSGRWVVRSKDHGEAYSLKAVSKDSALTECSNLIKFFTGGPMNDSIDFPDAARIAEDHFDEEK